MPEPTQKPVIFLAFANDKVDPGAHLRNLTRERNGVRDALLPAQEEKLCGVVVEPDVSIDRIINSFQNKHYRDRIAVFHYGGHADSYQLLLENYKGEREEAHSEGLVSFLAKQKGLQLVFLNGCCSQQQALDLIEAGLPAVIGTSQKIDDSVATKLSVRFYQGLATGLGIDRAWTEAIDQIKIEKGAGNVRGMHGQGLEDASDRFPWEIYYRQGAEQIKEWNLPEAVGNPLFGLPAIPKVYDLPDSPFLFLRRYERPHAEIFFGRSYYVRALCNRVNDPHADPLILLYGQSGVGKSSLLEAGLYPRLESDYTVIYARRHAQKGLIHTLGAALQRELAKIPKDQLALATSPQAKSGEQTPAAEAAEAQPGQVVEKIIHELETAAAGSPEAVKQEIAAFIERLRVLQTDAQAQQTLMTPLSEEMAATGQDTLVLIDEDILTFLEKWLVIEGHTNKPLLVILDQVEEHFTRPNPNLPDELDDFMLALRIIFSSPALRPKGKMILSYRKEYHAEIEARVRTFLLPRSTVFLETLNRKDILDIFRGVTQTPALQKRYHLTVDDELPVMIADDLLADKDSPVAPVLQIVLTKLWNAAVKENAEAPHFAAAQYQQLKKDGIAMGEFFEQQMKELRNWQRETVDSGLALDFLYFHTSSHGAADNRTLEALRRTYEHREETINALVAKCKELYLLTDSQQNQESTSLTHDTLAAEVIKQYNTSDKPGQRASRILGSKMREFRENDDGIWLDEMDLQIVEQGLPGMRELSPNEKKLLDLSRRRREELERERRRNRLIRRVLVTAIILFAGFAAWQWRESVRQKNLAEFQATVAQSNLLAKEADEMFQSDRTQALRLAEAAYQLNPTTSAEKALLKIFYQTRFEQRQFYASRMPHGSEVTTAVFSPDGSKILTTCRDDTARLWSAAGELLAKFPHEYEVNAAIFSPDGNEVLTAADDAKMRLWLVNGDSVRTYQHTNNVNTVRFSRDGARILTASDDDSVRLWSKSGGLIAAFRHQGAVLSAVFSNDENWILSASSDNTARRWSISNGTAITFQHRGPVYMAVSSPGDELVLTVSDDDIARLWSASGGLQKTFQHGGLVKSAVFLANNDEILTASDDGTARIWSTNGDLRETFKHRGPVFSAVSSRDGNHIVTASRDSTARLWSKDGALIAMFRHDDAASSAVFSLDGRNVLTASRDRTARLWPAAETDLITLQHEGEVNTAVFSPSGDFLLTASGDSEARLWSTEGELQKELPHDGAVLAAAFSPGGSLILTASRDKTARLWSLQGDMLAKFQHDSTVYAAVFAPDGKQILTASLDGKARLWSIDRGLLTTFQHRGPVYSVALSPDGRRILTASDDSTARLWSPEGKEITTFHHPDGEVWAAQFSPDGRRVLTASEDNTARLWTLAGKLSATFPHEGRVWKIAFSPEGNQILTASWDNFARLWSTDGKLIATYPQDGWLYSARFSSDGRHVLTASDDVTARLWSITGDTLMTFQHQGPVYFAVFSNDSRQILTASADRTARLWQTPAGIAAWLKTAEVYRRREFE